MVGVTITIILHRGIFMKKITSVVLLSLSIGSAALPMEPATQVPTTALPVAVQVPEVPVKSVRTVLRAAFPVAVALVGSGLVYNHYAVAKDWPLKCATVKGWTDKFIAFQTQKSTDPKENWDAAWKRAGAVAGVVALELAVVAVVFHGYDCLTKGEKEALLVRCFKYIWKTFGGGNSTQVKKNTMPLGA